VAPAGFDVRPVIWASDPRRAMPGAPKDARAPLESSQRPSEQIIYESGTTVSREGFSGGNPQPPPQ
jgi:hypothetical protein